mgnify:CR=1 FL=1
MDEGLAWGFRVRLSSGVGFRAPGFRLGLELEGVIVSGASKASVRVTVPRIIVANSGPDPWQPLQ